MVHQLKATGSLLAYIRNKLRKLSLLCNPAAFVIRNDEWKATAQKSSHGLYIDIVDDVIFSFCFFSMLFRFFFFFYTTYGKAQNLFWLSPFIWDTVTITTAMHNFYYIKKTWARMLWMIRQERTRLNHSWVFHVWREI